MSTSSNNFLTKKQADTVTVIHSMDYSNSSSQEDAQCSEDALSNFNDQTLLLQLDNYKGSFKVKCTAYVPGHSSEMTVHTALNKSQVVVTSLCSGLPLNCSDNVYKFLPISSIKIHS